MKCTYCQANTKIVSGQELYPNLGLSEAVKFVACSNCDAHVMCRKNTEEPDGLLADGVLRTMRATVFSHLNPMLANKGKKARAKVLTGMARSVFCGQANVNAFGEGDCKRAIDYLENLRLETHGANNG